MTLAHLTHASDDDIAAVAAAGARVVWNPASNLRLGSGVTRVRDLAAAGVPLGLGVDGGGFADDGDLLAEVRLGALLQRVADTDAPPLANRDVLAMAAGRLAPGEPADLVALAPLGAGDPIDAIVRRASARHVRAVYQGGEPLLTDGVLRRIPDDPPDAGPERAGPGRRPRGPPRPVRPPRADGRAAADGRRDARVNGPRRPRQRGRGARGARDAVRSASTSARLRRRCAPAARSPSSSGPNATRRSASTGWPTASPIRRTCRLRPSRIVISSTSGRRRRTRAGAVRPSSSSTPSRSAAQRGVAHRPAPHLGPVGARHLVARVHEVVGEVAVVRQQDEPGRVGVEAADGIQPRPGLGHEVDDGRAPVRVVRGRDDPGRLVEA